MIHRKGMNLMEVLIAIFIMGIGLMAVLPLFLVGAVKMDQSIKDDRHGHAAANAKAIATAKNIRWDPEVIKYFDDPDPNNFARAPMEGPSYAVFVDPIGYMNNKVGPERDWVGGSIFSHIRRRPLSFITDVPKALRWDEEKGTSYIMLGQLCVGTDQGDHTTH